MSSTSLTSDLRTDLLEEWLRQVLGDSAFELAPASEDASFRRNFRVSCGSGSWIAMDAPPDKEDTRPFLRVAEMLRAAGVHAPQCHARDLDRGFLLLEDLGKRTYLQALEAGGDEAPRLYADAIDSLVRMQAGLAGEAATLPPYDAALLDREMALFSDWLLGRHLGLGSDSAVQGACAGVFGWLREQVLQQPRVFVHRDYHSRNLMVTAQDNPGVLDFQDAVHGPASYDLVSLLRDCYVSWPDEQVRDWVASYWEAARARGLPVGESLAQFTRWFDLVGVQRHLKASGIFARLWYRDGKPGYLADVPRTLRYIQRAASRYPQLSAFAELLGREVLGLGDARIIEARG